MALRDIWDRDPPGVRSLVRRHTGETGLVVYAALRRPVPAWLGGAPSHGRDIEVQVDGESIVSLRRGARGPYWIALAPGQHYVEFRSPHAVHGSEQFVVVEDGIVLAMFEPPRSLPYRRPSGWYVRSIC